VKGLYNEYGYVIKDSINLKDSVKTLYKNREYDKDKGHTKGLMLLEGFGEFQILSFLCVIFVSL
jgi:hypothetical protein